MHSSSSAARRSTRIRAFFQPPLQIVSGRQREIDERADREAGPHRVGAEPVIGREDAAEAHRHQADREDDQRRPHRAVRAHRAEQHHRHPEQQEVPGREQVDVPRDRQRRAVAAHEQASTGRSASVSSDDQHAGDQHGVDDARAGDRADPVPLAGADILRGHRADRRAERHRRHLDIGPQLHRDAEGGGGVDAFAVDQADQRQRRQRDDDHLDAHRQALDDDRLQDRRGRAAGSAARAPRSRSGRSRAYM